MKISSSRFVKGITGEDKILYDNLIQIAFVGRSNVGKSSLINSLLTKNTLAKTGKKAGKTVEINFYKVNEKFYFADIPGYGYAKKGLDQREDIRDMIIEYLTLPNFKPRLVVLVLDSKAGLTDFDREMLDILSDNAHKAIIVLNKSDKLTQKELSKTLSDIRNEVGPLEVVPYSTITQKGKDALLQKLF